MMRNKKVFSVPLSLMAPDNGINQPQAASEVIEGPEFLIRLRDAVNRGDAKKSIEIIANFAIENKEVPEDVIKGLKAWSDEQKSTLASFLSAKSLEGITNDTIVRLRELAGTMKLGPVPEFKTKSIADTIAEFVNEKMRYLDSAGMIPKQAKLLGFESGNATKFLTGFFFGSIAGGFERMAFAVSKYSGNIENAFKTSVDLRMRAGGITDPKEQETFKNVYMAQVEKAKGNYDLLKVPKSLQEAMSMVASPKKETMVAEAKTEK